MTAAPAITRTTCERCCAPLRRNARRYCSRECVAEAAVASKEVPDRTCPRCGKPFNRHRYGSRRESTIDFAKRQHCSHACALAAIVRKPAKVYRCEKCGKEKRSKAPKCFDCAKAAQSLVINYLARGRASFAAWKRSNSSLGDVR